MVPSGSCSETVTTPPRQLRPIGLSAVAAHTAKARHRAGSAPHSMDIAAVSR